MSGTDAVADRYVTAYRRLVVELDVDADRAIAVLVGQAVSDGLDDASLSAVARALVVADCARESRALAGLVAYLQTSSCTEDEQ